MTDAMGIPSGLSSLGTCGAGAKSTAPCAHAFRDAALNASAQQRTNLTKEPRAATVGSAANRPTWASVVIAVALVLLVLTLELWAAGRTPAADGTVTSEVATELNATLAEVAVVANLIGPSD